MNDNKVLSQADIDAMLSPAEDSEEAPRETVAVAAPEIFVPPPTVTTITPPEPAAAAPVASPVAPPEPVAAAPVAPPVAPPAPAVAAPDNSSIDALQALVNQLAERLEKAEASLNAVGTLERAIAEINTAVRSIQQNHSAALQQLATLTTSIAGLQENSRGTLGYRARHTFQCDSCASKKTVATRIKCTSCGKENWWGWWPKK